jgi:pimeloyl-ACP methyl ester carboxylesterase
MTPALDTGSTASGASFVLVHGIGVSHRYFRPLVTELVQQHRVICIDLPGFGSSVKRSQGASIEEHAQAVGQIVDSLGLKQPILVGHSMGCQVVSLLQAKQPQRYIKLALIGPTVDPQRRSAFSHFRCLLADGLHEPPKLNGLITRDYIHCGPQRYLRTLGYMLDDHIEDRLAACQAETLVIRGAKDPIARPDWGRRTVDMLPHGKLLEVPGAAHVAHYTHPKQVAAACQSLLQR